MSYFVYLLVWLVCLSVNCIYGSGRDNAKLSNNNKETKKTKQNATEEERKEEERNERNEGTITRTAVGIASAR